MTAAANNHDATNAANTAQAGAHGANTDAPSEQSADITARAAALRALDDEALLKLAESAAQDAREVQRYLDLARRTQADFDNYQKRAETQRKDEARHAHVPFVRELLPVLDNLDRALMAARQTSDAEALLKGVDMTHKMFEQALTKFGVQPIAAAGEPFNPEIHEAVMTGTDENKENDVVLDCFEKGWRLHERVVRPAKVRVNKRDAKT